ncbi:hypothetical protein KEM48_002152 [Puccinia striiformis f. sp. tritici PST-130]|nr:hypothetical protein KEM48_002152 [Puccinia striiformis f. sp. tritici PST-130]
MSEDIPLTAPTHPRDPYDVIYEGSEHQATPRFLGAAMRDYRPLTKPGKFVLFRFMPDPGEDPSGTQSRTGLTTNVTSKEYDPNSFDDQINSGNGSPKKKNLIRTNLRMARKTTLRLASGGASAGKGGKLWGVGGDTIKTEDGHSFLYNNTFGGTWVSIPFNDTARAQGDQPSLEETWDYSNNRMLGVNLGGWLVLEPFITPSLFEPYANSAHPVVDEWTLCETLGTKAASTIENHYKTFITEQDFADIASAGLNWVRLPVAWWMIETLGNEPFVTGVSFKYFLKAITWARKYGLRINLDLHACPGSQNGWNHSGKLGTIGFLRGTMGIANAQRTLNYVRTLTQFISQSQYKHVIPTFSVLNEAQTGIIGSGAMRSWYYQVYQMIRNIGGTGTGNGPFMVIHDGFSGPNSWNGFLQGADRLGLDTHTYFCFGNQNTDTAAMNSIKPCQQLASFANSTMGGFGLSITGEFSQWLDDRQWTPEMKNGFADMAQTQQDVMRNSFFWTWKIGPSTKQDNVPNPMWNYQGGLRNSYIRQDARGSNGRCAAVSAAQGVTYAPKIVSGDLDTWQVGGQGAGQILASEVQKYSQFPPDVIGGGPGGLNYPAASLHRYVASGNPVTLVPSPVANGANHITAGSGWTNSQDTAKSWIAQPGCQYPDPWGGVSAPAPIHPCGI